MDGKIEISERVETRLYCAQMVITDERESSPGCKMPIFPLQCCPRLVSLESLVVLLLLVYLAVNVIKRLLIRGTTETAARLTHQSLTFHVSPVSLTPLYVSVHPTLTL